MIAGLFLYLIGLVLGFVSGAFRRVRNQRKVRGRIVSLEQRIRTPNKRITYTAIVSYVVGLNTYYVKTSYQSSQFRPGKELTVCYDEKHPQTSFVRAGSLIYWCMAACIIAGTALLFRELRSLLM